MKELKKLAVAATAIVSLSAIVIMGIAVIGGFKNTGLIDNTTANLFIAGLAVFGSFIGIIILALIGKIVVGMFQGKEEY